MFEQCLDPQLLPIIDRLVSSRTFEDNGFYLAGGTALALQIGHRISEDLDFFTINKFNPQTMIDSLQQENILQIMNMDDRTLNVLINRRKVSFFHYPYLTVSSLLYFRGCPLASCQDIAAMKIIAVAQRGSKKDFVDLNALLKNGLQFSQIMAIMPRKYPNIQYNLPHLLRSMAYFEDAEEEAMPTMNRGDEFSPLAQQEWENIKQFLIKIQKTELSMIIE